MPVFRSTRAAIEAHAGTFVPKRLLKTQLLNPKSSKQSVALVVVVVVVVVCLGPREWVYRVYRVYIAVTIFLHNQVLGEAT